MQKNLTIVFLLILLASEQSSGSQCIRKSLTPPQLYNQSSFVFEGVMFAEEELPSEFIPYETPTGKYRIEHKFRKYSFVVKKQWKGLVLAVIQVKVMLHPVCERGYTQGETALVYARGQGNGLETSTSFGREFSDDWNENDQQKYLSTKLKDELIIDE